MKNLLLLFLIFLCSCASNSQKVDGPRGGKVVTVDFKDDSRKDERGKGKAKGAFSDALTSEKKWFKMADEAAQMRPYLSKSAAVLGQMLNGASAQETSRIVAALSQKGYFAIPELAKVLTDKRKAVFSKQGLRWYEESNKPSEELELRVYAAFFMERLSTIDAYGVKFFIHKQFSKEGLVEILYATEGDSAVVKGYVCKTWLKWWNKNKVNYK